MNRLAGKIAFVTGAGRGQGRSHAVRLAQEGADIVAVDICRDIDTVTYALSTEEDLEQTRKEVEAIGRRAITCVADVRDRGALAAAVSAGVAELGGLDIVVANAGVLPAIAGDQDEQTWNDVIAVNLTGVWQTVEATKQVLIDQGRGGSIIITSSSGGLKGYGGNIPGVAYVASKHGVVGLARHYALSLAPHSIRVNTIHPTGVNTPMVTNAAMDALRADPSIGERFNNALPVEVLEPVEISHAVLWLASDESRFVTGVALPVDAGHSQR